MSPDMSNGIHPQIRVVAGSQAAVAVFTIGTQ
jgi:hypothetical protein